jgi:uncharacterized protein (TIGR00725 family)
MVRQRQVHIAVSGAAVCSESVRELAEEVGREIARRDAVLVCGGLGGVMEAAARGAHQAGGLTVGILPTYDSRSANQWLDVVIPSGLGHARNVLVAASGDAVIALPGEHGTASEIALALKLGRHVVALHAWQDYIGVLHATSPAEAVATAIASSPLKKSASRSEL